MANISEMNMTFKLFYGLALFLMFCRTGAVVPQNPIALQAELTAEWKLNEIPGEKIKNPRAIVVTLTGHVYIVDSGNERILQLNHQGKYLNQVGGFGWGETQFDFPADIATRDGLNIFVADFNNQRIQRYNKNLERISTLGRSSVSQYTYTDKQKKELEIGRPISLTLSPLGDLFFINQDKNEIVKLNASGQQEINFGGFRSGEIRLTAPSRIRAAPKTVFVIDNPRILAFDHFGNYLRAYGDGLIKRASDIAVDSKNRIYICDEERKCIFVFSDRDERLAAWMHFPFTKPVAMDIYRNQLYVLDNSPATVYVITITESRR